jgi:putative tricarboxylic transport membrane protein
MAYGFATQDIQLDFWAEEELFNARSFPILIAIGGSLLALLYMLFPPAFETPDLSGFNIELIGLVALMLLYAGFLEQLGFVVATGLFLCAGFLVLGERRPARLGLVTVTLTGGFYFLMTMLEIHLPQGAWTGVLEGVL